MRPGLLRHVARNNNKKKEKRRKESHRSPRGTESLPLKTFFFGVHRILESWNKSQSYCLSPDSWTSRCFLACSCPNSNKCFFFLFREGRRVFITAGGILDPEATKWESWGPQWRTGLVLAFMLYWGTNNNIIPSYILSLLPMGPQSDCIWKYSGYHIMGSDGSVFFLLASIIKYSYLSSAFFLSFLSAYLVQRYGSIGSESNWYIFLAICLQDAILTCLAAILRDFLKDYHRRFLALTLKCAFYGFLH